MEILNIKVDESSFSNKSFLLKYLSTCKKCFLGCRVGIKEDPSGFIVGGSSPDPVLDKR
jgi:hypothetical protein